MTDVDENGVDRLDRFRAYSQRFIQYSVACEVYSETLKYMQHLRKERDEARRTACKGEAIIRLQRNRVHRDSEEVVRMTKEIAVERGWNCFKENTND